MVGAEGQMPIRRGGYAAQPWRRFARWAAVCDGDRQRGAPQRDAAYSRNHRAGRCFFSQSSQSTMGGFSWGDQHA